MNQLRQSTSPAPSVLVKTGGAFLVLLILVGSLRCGASSEKPVVRVGSKSFTESFILAEIIAQIIENSGEATVERRLGLGGTGITHRAVASGDIDLYPEYTGTLSLAILKDPSAESVADVRQRLRGTGLTISDSIGFNNTYALAVREELAQSKDLKTISDLRGHPDMRAAFSSGFTDRDDGWPGLKEHYDLHLHSFCSYDATARVEDHFKRSPRKGATSQRSLLRAGS